MYLGMLKTKVIQYLYFRYAEMKGSTCCLGYAEDNGITCVWECRRQRENLCFGMPKTKATRTDVWEAQDKENICVWFVEDKGKYLSLGMLKTKAIHVHGNDEDKGSTCVLGMLKTKALPVF